MQKNPINLTKVLKAMADFEHAAAELYGMCGQTWEADKEFWADMERAEIKHAENIIRMSEIVSLKPEGCQSGHTFKPEAIWTSISGIQWNIERLVKKEITEKNMLFIARDVEQSMLESKYGDAVKSNDPEYQSLLKEIISDTVAHRERLNNKIREISS